MPVLILLALRWGGIFPSSRSEIQPIDARLFDGDDLTGLSRRVCRMCIGPRHHVELCRNGIVAAGDPDSLAELLAKEPDLSVERRNGEIVIRAR